jgi:hypothetical protein
VGSRWLYYDGLKLHSISIAFKEVIHAVYTGNAGFEFLTVRSVVFSVVTPYSSGRSRRFGG